VVVPDEPSQLPEGASVRIELLSSEASTTPRMGGIWKGQVKIAEVFDDLPDNLAETFGAANA
jgi:hypothetical protein